jgi:hypothetical protein
MRRPIKLYERVRADYVALGETGAYRLMYGKGNDVAA